jgi:hypothetical protein
MKNIYNVIDDVKNDSPYAPLNYSVEHKNGNLWVVRIRSPSNTRSAKLELILDEQIDSVVGCLMRHRGFSRHQIDRVINNIIDRF